MSWPDIEFSEEERVELQSIAITLERELEIESKETKEIALFMSYPPFANAIALAKNKKIDRPLKISNMGYWYFESPLGEWFHFSKSKAHQILGEFLSRVEGFSLASKKEDEPTQGERKKRGKDIN